jgi:hypothetical protein
MGMQEVVEDRRTYMLVSFNLNPFCSDGPLAGAAGTMLNNVQRMPGMGGVSGANDFGMNQLNQQSAGQLAHPGSLMSPGAPQANLANSMSPRLAGQVSLASVSHHTLFAIFARRY